MTRVGAVWATLHVMARRPGRRRLHRALPAALTGALVLIALLSAFASAAGPPFTDRPAGSSIVDEAGVFGRQAQTAMDQTLQSLRDSTGVDVVVYTQIKGGARTLDDAAADAQALLDQWAVGGNGEGAAMVWDFNNGAGRALVRIAGTPALVDRVGQAALDAVVDDTMSAQLDADQWLTALSQGVVQLSVVVSGAPRPTLAPGATPTPAPVRTPRPGRTPEPGTPPDIGPTPAAGPPYPDPISGVTVYDHAGILSDATIIATSATIATIEERTGAEIVVYTQVKPASDTPAKAEADAIALIDQWGVGRKGFDDGLAILFDMDDSKCHGQVHLYGGPGYRAAYLTNSDRQQIYEQEMLPYLRACDMSQALTAAMTAIDANATPEHARNLQIARQMDAAAGLVLAPLAVLGLIGWAGWSWLRYGKDPTYLDDPSVLMPAPPAGLSPAAASVILDGHTTRHALTTAMVDLAARGEIRFREVAGGFRKKVDIEVLTPDLGDARTLRNRRAPLGEAETFALGKLQSIADGTGVVTSDELLRFGKHVDDFDKRLGELVASRGWYREPPEKSMERWRFRAAIVLVAGVVGLLAGLSLPSSGLTLLGGGLIGASIAMFILAQVMPQRTLSGAMVFAWLAAYRRTLQKTLDHSRSMDEVVASRAVPWLDTPDQAVAWGYALGLDEEIEEVLERSVDDLRAGTTTSRNVYLPLWYGSGVGDGGSGGGSGGIAPGVFSSSAIPDFGAMGAALSTIGDSPSSSGSSGSGGSGGFSGGGSGGGGGGAGGGF